MKRKKRNRMLIMIVVIVLLALIICSFFEYSKIQDLKAANTMYQTELSNNQQTVYVATDLINAGDIVTDTGENANVEQTVYTGLESYNYITESEMNTRAKVDIAAGVPVMYNMVTDVVVDNDTRDVDIGQGGEYPFITAIATQLSNYIGVNTSLVEAWNILGVQYNLR